MTSAEIIKQIDSLETLLKQTETHRYLLELWIDYPEIKTLTFEDNYEYDDDGSYYRVVKLNDIEFISDEAMETLHERLDKEGYYDDETEAWQIMLFDYEQPNVDPQSMLKAFERPEDPEMKLQEIMSQIAAIINPNEAK